VSVRRLFNIAGAAAVFLCLMTVSFLLLVLPRGSPRNRASIIQLGWPVGADGERTYDLCTYDGSVYLGTRLLGPGMGGDPFSVKKGPPAPRHAAMWAGCSDLCWQYGGTYAEAFEKAGMTAYGVGFVDTQRPGYDGVLSVVAVTAQVWAVVAVAFVTIVSLSVR